LLEKIGSMSFNSCNC